MSEGGITLKAAAQTLNKSESTLRRWIRRGCPTVQLGETGREGSLLILEDVQRWRVGLSGVGDDNELQQIADSLLDTIKRDEVYERAGISERQAAIVLLLAFQRYFRNTKHRQIEKEDVLPDAIEQICTIAVR